jgi:predicted metalloprotease
MRWQDLRRSSNVEDRRGGGGGLRPAALGGVGGIGAIVIVVVALFFGVDPRVLLDGMATQESTQPARPAPGTPGGAPDEMGQFVSAVLANTEDIWRAVFVAAGETYQEPRLVLFDGGIRSACGFADSAVGPFYCPGDRKVYIDLAFFDELGRRFGAPGDFAQAYVVAHEVGHHVQNLMGIMEKADRARSRLSETEANALSVKIELQADCFAGVWAAHANRDSGILEPGDIEEALGAASAVGDDTLQRRGQGTVVPDSFTHGSSEQRRRWFTNGYKAGTPGACDTFAGTARL